MNLWIRSQDKKALIPINKMLTISCSSMFYDGIILGVYKTEQRALEILDEIQNILKPKIIYNQSNPIETMNDAIYQIKQDVDMKIQELSTYVYEMPKE